MIMIKSNLTFNTIIELDEDEKDVSVNFDWQGSDESVGCPGSLDLCEVIIVATKKDILSILTKQQIDFLKQEADRFLINLCLEEQEQSEEDFDHDD